MELKDTTIAALTERARQMCIEKGWGDENGLQEPQRIAMAMTVEMGELMEHFAWIEQEEIKAMQEGKAPEKLSKIAKELSDVFIYGIQLAASLHFDLAEAMINKMEIVLKRKGDKPETGWTD